MSHKIVKVEFTCCISLHSDKRCLQGNFFNFYLFLQKRQELKAHLKRSQFQEILLRKFRVVRNTQTPDFGPDTAEDRQFYFLEIHITMNLLLYARDNGAFVFIQIDNKRSNQYCNNKRKNDYKHADGNLFHIEISFSMLLTPR